MRVPRLPLMLAAVTFCLALGLGARAWREHFTTEPVLRVRITVPAGEPVGREVAEQVAVPAGSRPPGALTSLDQLAGLWARVELVPGEYLLRGHLTAEAPPRALYERMRPGMRAVSLPVRPEAVLGGALAAGDLVDVLAAYSPLQEGAAATTRTLAQGLRVLDVRNSAGTSTSPEVSDAAAGPDAAAELPGQAVPAAVLLEVDPQLAPDLIAAAEEKATFYLLLAGHQEGWQH